MEWIFEEGLFKLDFNKTKIDESVFFRNRVVILLYVDDGILCGPETTNFFSVVEEPHALKYDMEDIGTLTDYLGVQVKNPKDERIELTQPQLIEDIIKELGFNPNTKPTRNLDLSIKILNKDLSGNTHDETKFKYCSLIIKLNFIEKYTRADIAYFVHQCTHFSEDLRQSNTKYVNHLVIYLVGTK